jgi:hypothetical protein
MISSELFTGSIPESGETESQGVSERQVILYISTASAEARFSILKRSKSKEFVGIRNVKEVGVIAIAGAGIT